MFNQKGDKTILQVTNDLQNYADSLPEGFHMAWSSTNDEDVVNPPVKGIGYIYYIYKLSPHPIQIIAVPFSGTNAVYLKRKHGSSSSAWRSWVRFSGENLEG